MVAFLLAVLVTLPLVPPFGVAEATAVSSTDSMVTLDVRLEILVGAQVVVVQPYGPDRRPLDPRPMSDLGDGIWGAVLELPRRSDIRLGFEILDGGVRERSDVHTLVELGVDPAVFREPLPDPESSDETPAGRSSRFGWLALAAGAGALALLAFLVASGPGLRGARRAPVDSARRDGEDGSGNTDRTDEADNTTASVRSEGVDDDVAAEEGDAEEGGAP